MEALRTGNLNGAVSALQQFAIESPRDTRADNALYFAAVGLIGLEEFDVAASTLEKLIKSYPAGDAVLDGMLKLGECRVKLKQSDRARTIYHQVISIYPGTAAADQAQARLASLGP
jgi:TolA-binding protein